ncbi:nickel/cobalt efflux transporter [Robbsia sp. KACC 23696]|uniref:nickel/cobalt efflux transporter n=1 Tax=Robbsia sp. KACC 23696 TaxID=3149231 RepID=UPI00325BCF1A
MNLSDVLVHGNGHPWLYFPAAIVLGALHGLEPGHSKTMMAAFIVAVRGTVKQSILLGLSATLSHTLIVWIVAIGGMALGRHLDASKTEPYFQLASALLVMLIALWMLWRTWRDERTWRRGVDDRATVDTDAPRTIDTGHGSVSLFLQGDGATRRWRVRTIGGQAWRARSVSIVTTRADGRKQRFGFFDKGDYLESIEPVPEPYRFEVRLSLGHTGHTHDYDLAFGTPPGSGTTGDALPEVTPSVYQDAHERAHARDIETRFANRTVGTGQIVLFGLTGGLVPCPAAITVLLLCLQMQQLALGAGLVLCFSVGLALTLVTVGVAAAVSLRKASMRWPWLASLARRAPYLSSTVMVLIGLYVSYQAWIGISAIS